MIDGPFLDRVHAEIDARLSRGAARIDRYYYCPHHPEAGCGCRKPQPGMLLEVARRFNISLKDTYMAGDAHRDLAVLRAVRMVPLRSRAGGASAHDPDDLT